MSKYRLEVAGYSGDAGDSFQYTGSSGLYYQNALSFTTYDQDNDPDVSNCAAVWSGGWWYNRCYYACLTCHTVNHRWTGRGGKDS